MADYRTMTTEEFDDILETLCNEHTGAQLLRIPGVYEILSEHFNNDVLEYWEERQRWVERQEVIEANEEDDAEE
jgi:hypothetical protein